MGEKIRKDSAEWKKQLTQNQYFVTRQKGTEPPFTGEYEDTETQGTYKCVCCGQPLFRSDTKFHSGSGWPSFYAPASGYRKLHLDAAGQTVILDRAGMRLDAPWDEADGGQVQSLRCSLRPRV